MDLIGTRIVHKSKHFSSPSMGEGVITDFDGKLITIVFDNGESKKLGLREVFKSEIIRAVDPEIQKKIVDFINTPTPPSPPLPVTRQKAFWVFQNQTYDEESYNGYIYAPLHGPHHWERLKEVRAGDIIIHSYRAEVVAISVARDVAYLWIRYDGIQGRRIDCDYYRLRRCLSTSLRKTKNIELCAGAMYQPFNSNGTGNQGYLYDMTFKLRDYYVSEIVKYNPEILDKISELKKFL